MKKLFTLFAVLPAATVFGQITINSTDMPVPTSAYHVRNFTTASATNPVAGTSATWDYSAHAGTADSIVYVPETDAFFTSAGVDVYRQSFKSLIPSMGYYVYNEYDFNTTNIKEAAVDVEDQPYDISALTGGTADSLIIPAQRFLLSTPREIVRFPCTAGSTWTSASRRVITFHLSVASASLSHAPVDHAHTFFRTDSVVGWGKMRVYTSSGASIQYDVLMDKVREYASDSFYMGGSPAPATLLAAFGMSQGQKTDSNFRYNFYRKGSFLYLLTFYYKGDASFTNSVSKFMSSDNITPAGVADVAGSTYSSVIFPNPSNGKDINIMISGKDVNRGSYFITDMTGKTVKNGSVEMLNDAVHISLDGFATGNYFVNIIDNENNKIVTEQFSVAH